MNIHTVKNNEAKLYSETVKTPPNKRIVSAIKNSLKRALSLSPEVVETNIKVLRSNTIKKT